MLLWKLYIKMVRGQIHTCADSHYFCRKWYVKKGTKAKFFPVLVVAGLLLIVTVGQYIILAVDGGVAI